LKVVPNLLDTPKDHVYSWELVLIIALFLFYFLFLFPDLTHEFQEASVVWLASLQLSLHLYPIHQTFSSLLPFAKSFIVRFQLASRLILHQRFINP
jgi:hypothetical protein